MVVVVVCCLLVCGKFSFDQSQPIHRRTMPSTMQGRAKLYPREDPRLVYYPSQPVAGALPSLSTALLNFSSPRRGLYIVNNRGGNTSSTHDLEVSDEPPFELHVSKPLLSLRSNFCGEIIDNNGMTLFTITSSSHTRRSPALYKIYDESTIGSTKGMPKRIPVYTLADHAHQTPGVFVDAVLAKQDKPILSIRIEQPLGQDVSWVARDPKSDRVVANFHDFISHPGIPPTVTLRAEPPYSNYVPLMLALWAIIYDLYSKRVAAKQRRF